MLTRYSFLWISRREELFEKKNAETVIIVFNEVSGMYSFASDYLEGACPEVLEELVRTNSAQSPGYGLDPWCEAAAKKIREAIGRADSDVHFVPGGTPANVLAMCLLKPYEAVICAESGHINVHETGAVEAVGHKILAVPGKDGKISAASVRNICDLHTDEHMVRPKMVFLSHASEYGTIYSRKELEEIREVCTANQLYLYIDGARIANALCAKGNDLTLPMIAAAADLFYIGGTKNGALLGEAMVINHPSLKPDFRYLIKQRCSMLAKGRILGVQFLRLFQDDLYLRNADHANRMAQKLKQAFIENGCQMYIVSLTNQIFPIVENALLEKLKEEYEFLTWAKYDENHTVIRLVCSWATKEEIVQEFCEKLKTVK